MFRMNSDFMVCFGLVLTGCTNFDDATARSCLVDLWGEIPASLDMGLMVIGDYTYYSFI